MNSADFLKAARGSGYGSPEKEAQVRSFPLTEDEIKSVPEGPAMARGEHRDGKFHVHSIEPEQGRPEAEPIMVKTPTNISPS